MTSNTIVDEVRRIREELLAEFGGNIDALVRDMQRQTVEAKAAGQKVAVRRPREIQVSDNNESRRQRDS